MNMENMLRVGRKHILFIVIAILGLYATLLTTFNIYQHMNGTKSKDAVPEVKDLTQHQEPTKAIEDKPPEDGATDAEPVQLQEELPKKQSKVRKTLDKIIKAVVPEKNVQAFRSGIATFTQIISPRALALTSATSIIITAVGILIVASFGYLCYRSATSLPLLLEPERVSEVQNYARICAISAGGGFLLCLFPIYMDINLRTKGVFHAIGILLAVVACLGAFAVTFCELYLSAQTMHLPEITGDFFSGKQAQSMMSWMMAFLTLNMQTLGAGLLIMWVVSFAVQWVLKRAQVKSGVHTKLQALALPLTVVYMTARKSGSLFQMIMKVVLLLLSVVLAIDLLSPSPL